MKLLPGVRVERRGDEFVISKLGNEFSVSPEQPDVFEVVIRQLKSGINKDTLQSEFEPDLSGILDWLETKRFLGQAGTAATRHKQIVAAQAGYKNLDEAIELIRNATVGMIDTPAFEGAFKRRDITRNELNENERHLGFGSEVDLVIATGESIDELVSVNRKLTDAGVPGIYIWEDGPRLFFGPFYIPGMTACLNCLHHQINFSPTDVVSVPCETFTIQSYAPIVLRDVYRFLGRFQYPDTRDAIIELDTTSIEKQKHSVFKIPNCEHCGTKSVVDR